MYVLIVEDDKLQYEFIAAALRDMKRVSRVARLSTEKEFYDTFEELTADKPDVILMDVMLRWTDPAPRMVPPPEEVSREGFYRAGLRCVQRLAADPRTADVPVIIYSVLEPEDLSEDFTSHHRVRFLQKNFDRRELERMLEKVSRD